MRPIVIVKANSNIFPSNIQGPWYEVRVNDYGYLGRRGGVDFVVAVNNKTLRQDYDGLLPGGYFLFDSTKVLPDSFNRKDIIEVGIPLTELCNKEFENPRQNSERGRGNLSAQTGGR